MWYILEEMNRWTHYLCKYFMTKLNEEAFFCVFPDKSGCSKYLCIFWYLVPMSCEMKEEYFLKLDFQQEKLFEAVRDTTFLKHDKSKPHYWFLDCFLLLLKTQSLHGNIPYFTFHIWVWWICDPASIVCCESFFVLSMQFNLDKCTGV